MLSIDTRLSLAALEAMLLRLVNPEPALAVIGTKQRDAIRRRIERGKHEPDGNAWVPWRQRTRDYREAKGNVGQGLLWDDGTLLDNIVSVPSASEVVIGTPVHYAGFLQDGTSRMDARPFMGWTEDDKHHAEMTMLHYIEGVL